MKKDGRRLDRKAQEAIRLMAVERVRGGESPSAVIGSYGMNRTTIHKWLNRAKGRGAGLHKLKARKGTGRPRSLTDKQEQRVFRWINGKNPMQYGFDSGLWTRRIVSQLVLEKYGVKLSLGSISALLARLNLTRQKPLRRIAQRDTEGLLAGHQNDAIERWQRDTYPAIAHRAKAEGAEIYLWDESGFRAGDVREKTAALSGKAPVVQAAGRRQSLGAAYAVNSKGGFWHATYKGGLTGELFVELLGKLICRRKKSLHLLVDGLPAHKKKCVKEYVASLNGSLQLHFLPCQALEL